MPLKYQDVVNNPEYKDKLNKLNQKRIDRLQSEYDKFALTGSRDSGDKTLRTTNGTVLSLDTDLDIFGVDSVDQIVPVKLEKQSVNTDKVAELIDTEFSELIGTPSLGLTIQEFFNEYERLKTSIDAEGSINSHRYLVEESVKFIGGQDELDRIRQKLERELQELEELIAAQAEVEAEWATYLADMLNFSDTTRPYDRATWESKGRPVASIDAGEQSLRFTKNEPYVVAPTKFKGRVGEVKLPYRVSNRFQRRGQGTLSGPNKPIQIKVDAAGDSNIRYRWFVNNEEVSNGDRFQGTDTDTILFNPEYRRKDMDKRTFKCIISDSSGQGELSSGPIVVKAD